MSPNTELLDGFGLKYFTRSSDDDDDDDDDDNNNNNNDDNDNSNVCLCICALPVLVTLVRADPAAERRE